MACRSWGVSVVFVFTTGCFGIVENGDMAIDGGSSAGVGGAGGEIAPPVTSGTPSTSGSTTVAATTTTGATAGPTTSATTGVVDPSTTGGAGGASIGTAGGGGSAGVEIDASGAGGAAGPDGGRRSDGGTTIGSDASTGGATFTQVRSIVQKNCASCHNGFTTYSALTTHAVGRCGNDTLAKANDPANSAFLELVQGQCGSFLMPRGCRTAPCLSAADIGTFTAWINAGAPNN